MRAIRFPLPTYCRAFGQALLRVAAIASLTPELVSVSGCVLWVQWAIVAGLALGLLTRACAACALILLLLGLTEHPWPWIPELLAVASLIFVGGGAWSVDRLWFGRRVVYRSSDSFG